MVTKALPKMAKGSHDSSLAEAFASHLKETEGQIKRLEKVVTKLFLISALLAQATVLNITK